jgi:aryl sulfotransferase
MTKTRAATRPRNFFFPIHTTSTRRSRRFHVPGDEIVIATYAKSGNDLGAADHRTDVFGPDPELGVASLSPWLDRWVQPRRSSCRWARRVAASFSEDPSASMRWSSRAGQIHLHWPRRARMSFGVFTITTPTRTKYGIRRSMTLQDAVGPPIERPPADIRQYWREWLDGDGYPWWSFWENVRDVVQIRRLPNVLFVIFRTESDMRDQMRTYCGLSRHPIDEQGWPTIVEYCYVRLDEAQRHQECSARRGVLGRRCGGVHKQGRQRPLVREPDGRRMRRLRGAAPCGSSGPECARWACNGREPCDRRRTHERTAQPYLQPDIVWCRDKAEVVGFPDRAPRASPRPYRSGRCWSVALDKQICFSISTRKAKTRLRSKQLYERFSCPTSISSGSLRASRSVGLKVTGRMPGKQRPNGAVLATLAAAVCSFDDPGRFILLVVK